MHGGAAGSGGRPGNRSALKHGRRALRELVLENAELIERVWGGSLRARTCPPVCNPREDRGKGLDPARPPPRLPAPASSPRPIGVGLPGMRILVVVNAEGGTVRSGDVDAERLSAALARAGLVAEVVFAASAAVQRTAERALREAAARRVDAVVVGGGDGTVGTVAAVVAGTGVPLGILPLGTLNHFAKDLGLPLDVDGAAGVIAAAWTREVDVAEVNGRVFVNNSSIGLYPYMVVDRERRRSTAGHGKGLAMALAFLRMLWRFPRRRLSIRSKGWSAPYRTPCLFVGNNEYSVELLTLGRRRRLDAGKLWLFVATPRSARALLWFAFRAAFGGLDQAGDFETLRAEEVEIRMRTSRVHVALDGEVATLRPPLTYRVRPGALRVLAPAPPAS